MHYTFFDEEKCLAKITKLGDTLEQLNGIVNWAVFPPLLNKATTCDKILEDGKAPMDCLMMFKILVIKRLYNLTYDQTEYQVNDRLSFRRFLGLGFGDTVPDARTIWLYEDELSKSETGRELFNLFNEAIEKKGYVIRTGLLADASFVEVPSRRNTKELHVGILEAINS